VNVCMIYFFPRLLAVVPFAVVIHSVGTPKRCGKPAVLWRFMSGVRTNASMIVAIAVAVHLRCHTSTKVFEISDWLRLSRINDGVSKTFPLFVGHFVTQGASIVLPGISPIVEVSCSWSATGSGKRCGRSFPAALPDRFHAFSCQLHSRWPLHLIDVPSSRRLGNPCSLLSRRHKTSKGLGHSGVHLS